MAPATESATGMLRHTVATLAYRGGKAIRGAPPEFSGFQPADGTHIATRMATRTPGQILAHIGDLLDWALKLADGKPEWRVTPPQTWEQDTARFFAALQALDARLARHEPLGFPAEKLFQGPIADALTHAGQISILRRMAGAPVRGENYFKAQITAGRVGAEQAAPAFEFD
jgi:hypothetical protein